MQLEGLIGKRRDAPYAAGRSPHWIKLKCRPVDEFVIGGWTDPAGSRSALGALLVGVHDDADGAASGTRLRYAGRVGTGFTEATLTRLRRALTALATDRPPFDPAPRLPRSNRPHWVEPRLVAQVEYAELTSEGLLRQASFLGLREDKPAAEVVSGADTAAPAGEDVTGAAAAAPAVAPAEPVARAGRSGRGTRTARGDPSSDSTGTPAPASSRAVHAAGAVRAGARRKVATAATAATTEAAATAAQSDLPPDTHVSAQLAALPTRISHADRVVYANGLTKLDVARYYATMAPLMLPELRGRPLSLLRCPQGTQGTCFFQKHIATRLPPGLVPVQVQEKDGPSIYIAVDHEEGLVSLAQHAAIELHPWGSRVPDLARPDRLVIDLDPDESIDWPTVIEAAWLARTLLEELGLTAFVRTTGGKGLHVVSPLTPRAPWSTVKPFAQAIARQLARVAPQRFTSNMAKDKRRGRIFIDYLRNAEGATAIASFSLRARDGAPVAMPVAWDELKPKRDLRNDHFNLRNAAAAAAAAQAAWAGIEAAARPLQPSMLAALDLDPALSLD
jgi:bifunctional non-homologous end joining protein LigD